MNTFTRSAAFIAASASLVLSGSAYATTITGAGSTFVYPVLSRWAADYKKAAGDEINYQSIGSGGGIAQIKAGTVDFGATDKPLTPEELSAAGLAQFPVVIGGVVPVINIPGARPGQVKMSGPVLADIYAGAIKTWNDPRITKLNPGLHFPAKEITPVHRSDGSGTTFNFTHYLSQVSPGWKSKFGEGATVSWNGGIGGKGNEGVAGYVKQIPYSIGYVEYAYVVQNKMAYTMMQNSAGKFDRPKRKILRCRGGNRRLDPCQGFLPGDDQRAGSERVPDHRIDIRADVQAAEGRRRNRGGQEVLQLGVGKGTAAGAGPRLRSASRAAGEAYPDLRRIDHQVRGKQPKKTARRGRAVFLCFVVEGISGRADGPDQVRPVAGIECLPQPAHMDVDGSRVDIGIMLQTASSSRSREKTRPGCSRKCCSRRNSVGPSGTC